VAAPSGLTRLVVASGLANLADGVFQVALPLVALGITRDPGAFATVTLVGRLPWVIVALPAGALADRLDRRRTMLLVQGARVVLIGALAAVVAGGWEELWILYLTALALGVGEVLFDTAAQSIVPTVVADPDALARANGRLYAVELTANEFVGPAVGGLVAGLTLAGALTGSAVAYLLAAACLLTLTGSFRPVREGPPTRLRTDVAEGLSYLIHHRVLRSVAVCVGLSNLGSTAVIALLPLYAVRPGPMGLAEAGYGFLLGSFAVGALIAAPLAERIETALGRARTLVVALALFPLMPLTLTLTDTVWVVAVAFSVAGAAGVVWNVVASSLRQRIVPDHLLGRVSASHRLAAWGTMPLGAALAGVLGETIGLRSAFAVCTVLVAACLPIWLLSVSAADLEAAEPARV
jgi:MFS family permease